MQWLQLGETELVGQQRGGGGEREAGAAAEAGTGWRALQVACGLNHTAAVVELGGA